MQPSYDCPNVDKVIMTHMQKIDWTKPQQNASVNPMPLLPTTINFNPCIDKYFHYTLWLAYEYLSMLGLKLIHVSKRGR